MKRITVKENTQLPGTDTILEAGDKIQVQEKQDADTMINQVIKYLNSSSRWVLSVGSTRSARAYTNLDIQVEASYNTGYGLLVQYDTGYVRIMGRDIESVNMIANGIEVMCKQVRFVFAKSGTLRTTMEPMNFKENIMKTRQTIIIEEDVQIPGTDIVLEAGDKIRVLTEATATNLKWRPFNRLDWIGMSGAEKFDNGDEPFIAHSGDYTLIVDGRGIQIMDSSGDFWNYSFGYILGYTSYLAESASEGWELAEPVLSEVRIPISLAQIERVGFE